MADHLEVMERYASDRLGMARFALIMVFLIEQRWRYVIEKELESDGITPNQWLMIIVISAGFRHSPSIQEVADALSTTHQNVKQIASGLERRGLMTLARDPGNRRIIRLAVTEKCHALFERREPEDVKSIAALFENLSDDEMKALFGIIARMESQADALYRAARKGRHENQGEN
jgi:DNA-binding MarR family transcriptional regulator